MAKRVTDSDIKNFNALYYKYNTYTEVARETGFSASTVKKYIIPNWRPIASPNAKHLSESDIPEVSTVYFKNCEHWGDLCLVFDDELDGLAELWEEMSI